MNSSIEKMNEEMARMKAQAMPPPLTQAELEANKAYMDSLNYDVKPANCTDKEWAAILRYRKTGVPDFGEYEELDFNNVGGTLSNQEGEKP